MTIQQELDDVHKADGLFNDPEAAARNRANIEQMRAKETPHHSEGGLRFEPLLPKPKVLTKQEDEMGNKHINDGRDFDKEKGVIIADYIAMPFAQFLRKNHISFETWKMLRERWGVQKKGQKHKVKNQIVAPAVIPNKPDSVSKTVLPSWNEAWGDTVKCAWLEVWGAHCAGK